LFAWEGPLKAVGKGVPMTCDVDEEFVFVLAIIVLLIEK
jgi:hypothetical protein